MPGVHQKVAEILKSRLPSGSRIVDLGAGEGALSLRLHEAGFEVVAFDVADPSGWRLADIPYHQVDLNRNPETINQHGPFAAICAVEVIEHLENPRQFLRVLAQACGRWGAVMIVTTPNPLDTFSCISLFTRGTFNWFSAENHTMTGHISILPHWLVREHLKCADMHQQEWHFLAPYRHPVFWKRWIYRLLVRLRRKVRKSGDCGGQEGQTALVVAMSRE